MMISRTVSKVVLVLLLAVSVWLVATTGVQPSRASKAASNSAQAGNLLQNPGFEGGYQAWSGINELQVAANWTPWWWEDPDHNPAYFRPEYKRALSSLFPNRVLSGDSAQQWFTFYASHVAGMYQQVFNVAPGQHYRFSIWAQVWSSTEDLPDLSISPANPHLQIGIDPTGNWDAGAPSVVWSGDAPMSGIIDHWGFMAVEATAANNVITVFMRTNPDFANKHNDMYWDNASLEAVQPPAPTAVPSPTAGPPTNTPQATSTPTETNTPLPTDTPSATPTPTALPTETATATPSPTDTSTPQPTDTPQPTNTPTSTATEAAVVSQLPPVDEASTGQGGEVANQETASDQAAESSRLGILALVAMGVAILLLLVLILALLRGMRAR